MAIIFSKIRENNKYLNCIKTLYLNAFPPEERRDWHEIESLLENRNQIFDIYIIIYNNNFAGFISWWNFQEIIYIEHFATIPQLRGLGIGSMAISAFIKEVKTPIVLEVEPSSCGSTAQRRIDFYRRNGFHACEEYDYIQPPYNKNLPEVRLMLMTTTPSDVNLDKTTALIHRNVYKKD